MRDLRTKIATTAIAAALIFSPTAATASTYSAPAASNAWITLSELTPAGATALAGAGAAAPDAATLAAAQSTVAVDEPRTNPLPLPVIAVLLAVLGGAVYIALIEKHHSHRPFLISPA